MDAEQILLGALAAAGIVLSGALYALFFALARLRAEPRLNRIALVAYAVLVLCAVLLATALQLGGPWRWIVPVLLIGYLAAPSAVWRLSVATHLGEDDVGERGSVPRN